MCFTELHMCKELVAIITVLAYCMLSLHYIELHAMTFLHNCAHVHTYICMCAWVCIHHIQCITSHYLTLHRIASIAFHLWTQTKKHMQTHMHHIKHMLWNNITCTHWSIDYIDTLHRHIHTVCTYTCIRSYQITSLGVTWNQTKTNYHATNEFHIYHIAWCTGMHP